MLVSNPIPLPEQGQIVTIRQRHYVVTDILRSGLPADGLMARTIPQHLVTLNAIEDDALGESLQVIWELEPGAQISEKVELPEPVGFDAPQRLDAFLDAVRWGAVTSADFKALQAPFRSGIDIQDYQLDPLVRAIQMPRVSLLIADDVGLGKTIEAGMVIQELIVRNRARTVLIVCPSGLQIHWRDQMRDKFGLDFRIVDSQLMKELRRSRGIHVNPWSHFPRLITSIDFLKRERPMRLFREVLPAEGEEIYPRRFDIMVVDEAHNVAPSGHGQYAIESLRTLAVRELTPHFEHKLFLTATPHNGYQESFSALLELLDNQRFARGVLPNKRQLEAVMVRRLKSELVTWNGDPRFPQRRLQVIEVDYTEDERRVHRWLKEYTALRQKNAQSEAERTATEFVMKLLKKRLFSSPAAFASTLAQHERSLSSVQKRTSKISVPTMGILRRQIAQIDEDYADDAEYEDATHGAAETATQLFRDPDPHELQLLEQMRQWAETASARRDCKTRELIQWLHTTIKPNGKWSNERVIIFTEYRATQNWLQDILASDGLSGEDRLMTLYGGMESDKRESVKAAFQASPDISPVRILLATDAASEGIDLQNYCHRLIHVEIPWNPNRLEQRNGRIDRHGQKHDPLIYHFVSKGYVQRTQEAESLPPGELDADLEFLMRAATKVEQIREDLGKVGPVIALQVEEAMLGHRKQLDTQHAEHEANAVRKMLKFERDLLKQIEKQFEQLKETKIELDLFPENIQAVVEIALELAGQPPLRPAEVPGLWPDPDRPRCPVFKVPALTGSWAACAEGLAHPHTGVIRPVVFDHALADGRDDVVLAHLNHRLVQMSMRLLRAEVWSPEGRRGLYRVTARIVPDHVLEGVGVIAHARLVVIGSDSHRLHEEVVTAGGLISKGSYGRMTVGDTIAALENTTNRPVSAAMQKQLADFWPKIHTNVLRGLEARVKDRINTLQNLLAGRAKTESDNIEAVLNELAAAIAKELDDPEYRQLELFTVDEREQLTRNKTALRARLEQIPGEIEAEKAVIRKRYEDPEPRLFPVAITFLVPESLNR